MTDAEFNQFDNDTDPSDENYFAFVRELEKRTAAELMAAQGNPDAQKAALARYWHLGCRARLTPAELIDFLGVDAGCILEQAGLTDDEGDAVMALPDALTEQEVNKTVLD